MIAPIRKIVDRYRHLPRIAFSDKVRFAIWKHLFRQLQQRGVVDGCGELVNARFAKKEQPAPESTYKRLIFVCGFGWSGSCAVADLLREYAPVTRIPAEFDLARAAGGLFSLEHAFETQSIFEREAAFRLFLALVEWFSSYREVPFEYLTVKVPLGAEAQLDQLYGKDWRTPKRHAGFHNDMLISAHRKYKDVLVEKFGYQMDWLRTLP